MAYKASWGLLWKDRELFLAPGFVLLTFLLATALALVAAAPLNGRSFGWEGLPLLFGVLWGFWLIAASGIAFSHALVLHTALVRLDGQDPKFWRSVVAVWRRPASWLGWQFAVFTGGVLLGSEASRVARSYWGVGRNNPAWKRAGLFVPSLLLRQSISLREAILRSAEIHRGTNEDDLKGFASIGAFNFLTACLAIPLFGGILGLGQFYFHLRGIDNPGNQVAPFIFFGVLVLLYSIAIGPVLSALHRAHLAHRRVGRAALQPKGDGVSDARALKA